jgi:hypothetical protein
MVEHCRDELVAGEYIQNETQILSASPESYRSVNNLMNDILKFLQQVKD